MKEIKDLTILVVDDEPDLGELVAFEFELVGAQVLSATNGKEAFEIVNKHPIDVVVSDIRMPGGDGVELLERIRARHPSKPALLFMTGFADITLEVAYNKGAVAMFGKPFNRTELIEAVGTSTLSCRERWGKELSNYKSAFPLHLKFTDLKSAKENKQLKLGRGGFFVALEEAKPAVSEVIQFHFEFANESIPLWQGEGVVRWVRRQEDAHLPKGAGIEVKNLVGNNRDQILDFFANEPTVAYIPKGD